MLLIMSIPNMNASLKLNGESFPACEFTRKEFDLKQYCLDKQCNTTEIDVLTSYHEEYNKRCNL